MITQEKVCTLFGCRTSASRKELLPVLERHEHLLIYPVQYEGLQQSPHVVYTGATPNQQMIPAVRWAFDFLGARRFFLLGWDSVYSHAAHAVIREELTTLAGPCGLSPNWRLRVAEQVKLVYACSSVQIAPPILLPTTISRLPLPLAQARPGRPRPAVNRITHAANESLPPPARRCTLSCTLPLHWVQFLLTSTNVSVDCGLFCGVSFFFTRTKSQVQILYRPLRS